MDMSGGWGQRSYRDRIFKPASVSGKSYLPAWYILTVSHLDKWKIIFNNNLFSWGLHMDQTKTSRYRHTCQPQQPSCGIFHHAVPGCNQGMPSHYAMGISKRNHRSHLTKAALFFADIYTMCGIMGILLKYPNPAASVHLKNDYDPGTSPWSGW